MELQLFMLLKRKAMAKIHHSSVTSQISRHFDISPQQFKDKLKKTIHKITFKRHYTIHMPPLQTEQMAPPASQSCVFWFCCCFFFFLLKKNNQRRTALLLTVTFQQKPVCHCWGEAWNTLE